MISIKDIDIAVIVGMNDQTAGMTRKMKKVFTLVIDENNEPIIVEEDVILEDILNSLASISKRIDDIQLALIKNDDVDTSSDLDISKIDF